MEIDRNALLATGGATSEAMSSEERAEALERYMIAQLGKQPAPALRRGAGALFGGPGPRGRPGVVAACGRCRSAPTLGDFFRLRFAPRTVTHLLQSATRRAAKGRAGGNRFRLPAPRHRDQSASRSTTAGGRPRWWSRTYPESVSWAIRHHQALRFYRGLRRSGYEYPQRYVQIFGEGFRARAPYIKAAYEHARKHSGTCRRARSRYMTFMPSIRTWRC